MNSTGFSRSTVNGAVAKLLAEERVSEIDVEEKGPGSGSGRPATRLMATATGAWVAGVDFGHNHLHVAVAGADGAVAGERRIELDVDLEAEQALDEAARLLGELRARYDIDELGAVVAGIPGPLHVVTGLVQSPTILSGWVGADPAAGLERRIGLPVHVENDAVLGAHGELYAGAGREHRDFLYVKASHGVGASLVIGGEVYRGASGLAGEIGHTKLPGRAELCRCGAKGCLEAVVSVAELRAQVAHSHPGLDVAELELGSLEDPVSDRILEDAGWTTGRVLADLCNLVNPSAVILGGEVGVSGPAYVAGVDAAIRRYAQPATVDALVVRAAELGVRAELVGALEVAGRLVTV
ncbi:MAG: ROK family protein [Nocardioides sp.]|uniref:ROK family protein n=1 Tax=Nocardioides sp. TaxID=35761 RepID=UPI0039E49660